MDHVLLETDIFHLWLPPVPSCLVHIVWSFSVNSEGRNDFLVSDQFNKHVRTKNGWFPHNMRQWERDYGQRETQLLLLM